MTPAVRVPSAMRAKQLITVAIAALLLVGVAAAVGATGPADQANNDATDAPADVDTPAESDGNASEGDEERAGPPADAGPDGAAAPPADVGPSESTGVGPSGDRPAQVPDHVNAIHDTIESFLDGGVDSLGEALSDLLSDEEGPEDAESGDETESNDTDGDDEESEDGDDADSSPPGTPGDA